MFLPRAKHSTQVAQQFQDCYAQLGDLSSPFRRIQPRQLTPWVFFTSHAATPQLSSRETLEFHPAPQAHAHLLRQAPDIPLYVLRVRRSNSMSIDL
jgi:uncharacterized caspase-like protein